MIQQNTSQIIVFGNTFAAGMTVLALSKVLPSRIKLLWVKPTQVCTSDLLYGGITSPDAYQFNLQHDVTEPELILGTDTTFSFGSHLQNWGHEHKNWMQCFHLPFAATAGVEFHHFMTRHQVDLGDYLISAQAGMKGTFAHPPQDKPQSPLSRTEYGYHFDTEQWSSIFLEKIEQTDLEIIYQNIASIKYKRDCIEYIHLEDGSTLKADLFVDCSGTSIHKFSKASENFVCQRDVYITRDLQKCTQTGPACRSITGTEEGWQSVTPLRGSNQVLRLLESSFADEQSAAHFFTLGHMKQAWQGNCVRIGHAAYALEPISPAPYILLKKDIERLLELIPVGHETQIERQEYNRRFQNDLTHAELFHSAMYAGQRDVGFSQREKLDRKLSQYLHRGILASYDFEPFNQQDWAILHAGLGRIPKCFDRMAEQVEFNQMNTDLQRIREGLAHLSSSMPPHHIYLEKLSMYLRNNAQHGE
jgi:tryptophan halogenase